MSIASDIFVKTSTRGLCQSFLLLTRTPPTWTETTPNKSPSRVLPPAGPHTHIANSLLVLLRNRQVTGQSTLGKQIANRHLHVTRVAFQGKTSILTLYPQICNASLLPRSWEHTYTMKQLPITYEWSELQKKNHICISYMTKLSLKTHSLH